MELKEKISRYAEETAAALATHLQTADADLAPLYEAMAYSAMAGGKRLRPFLTLAVAEALGGTRTAAMPFACGIEMIHTYSLIHDDLPAMDNDDLRRGKPTCHKVYGEATALLAGDALLTMAFEMIAGNDAVSPKSAARAAKTAARLAGAFGMCGGQMMDLSAEAQAPSYDGLMKIHAKKTGALLAASVLCGVYAATDAPSEELLAAMERYALKVGAAFQICDDVLDVVGDEASFGKPIGSDAKNGKTTILSFMSIEEASALAKKLTEEACESVSPYDDADATLASLARMLLARKS